MSMGEKIWFIMKNTHGLDYDIDILMFDILVAQDGITPNFMSNA